MCFFVNAGVSVGFAIGDIVGNLIDGVTLGAVIRYTLGDLVWLISRVGAGLGSTLGDDAEIKFI